jgi:hypothetical protein
MKKQGYCSKGNFILGPYNNCSIQLNKKIISPCDQVYAYVANGFDSRHEKIKK